MKKRRMLQYAPRGPNEMNSYGCYNQQYESAGGTTGTHGGNLIEHYSSNSSSNASSSLSSTSSYKMSRNVSNSHPALERSDVHVEYEVAVPIHSIESIRHTPYHSLWNLHEW